MSSVSSRRKPTNPLISKVAEANDKTNADSRPNNESSEKKVEKCFYDTSTIYLFKFLQYLRCMPRPSEYS